MEKIEVFVCLCECMCVYLCYVDEIIDPRQTNTGHNKLKTIMLCLGSVVSWCLSILSLSCLLFVCLGFVMSNVCLSRVFDITVMFVCSVCVFE